MRLRFGVLQGFRSVRGPRNAERPHERHSGSCSVWSSVPAPSLVAAPSPHALSVARGRARRRARTRARARSALTSSTSARSPQERLATLTDAQEQLSASFKALSADALKSSIDQLTELNRAQLQRRQAEARGDLDKRQPGGRAARRAAEGTARPGRRPAAGARSGSARVARAARGAAPDARRDRREAADRDRRARDRAAQAQRARAVGPDAAAQRGRARRHGEVLRLRRAAAGCRRRDDAATRTWSSICPGGKHVVVDAKAPLQGVLDAYQARDEAERQQHLRDHARLLRRHVQGARRQGVLGGARLGARTSS